MAKVRAGWLLDAAERAALDAPKISGFAHVDNIASRRVLEKVGMAFEREGEFAGLPNAFYRLRRA